MGSPRASSSVVLAASFALTALAALTPRTAHACGAAYPGGPVMCDFPRRTDASGAPNPDADRTSFFALPTARVSTSYGFTSTTLLFTSDHRAELTRHALFGAVEIPLARSRAGSAPASLQVGAGGIAGGELTRGAARDGIGPGGSVFVGIAKRIVEGRGAVPFVQLTGTISATHALTRTRSTSSLAAPAPAANADTTAAFTAVDFRFGAIAGKTFGGVFTPYVTARVFGGPVLWRIEGDTVVGTDLYKYQVGGGLSLALFERHLDLFAEGIGLGERGVAAGVGTTFF